MQWNNEKLVKMDDFLSLAAKALERWYWVDMTFRFQYNGWIFRNTGYSVVFQVIRWRRHLYCSTILVMSLVNLSLPYCTHYYQMCICAVLAGYSVGKITLRKWVGYSNEMNNHSSHRLLWNSITTIYKTCMIMLMGRISIIIHTLAWESDVSDG